MKKFLQNLALAILAIAGVVSSCKIEDIKTTFDPSKAVATITVTAYDATNGNADISKDSALKLEASSTANNVINVSGNVITIEGGPALQEQVVTINAEYNGNTGKVTVPVNSLLAGGKASYAAAVVVGLVPSDIASAFVHVSVWDRKSAKDVTAESTLSTIGVPEGYACKEGEGEAKGTFVITNEGDIKAFELTVRAEYGGLQEDVHIQIGDIAKRDSKTYVATIPIGEPVKVPAVANIHVVVVDGLSKKEVTSDATITADLVDEESEATVNVVGGNVVTVTAGESLELVNESVLITVTYKETEFEKEFVIANVPAGTVGEYATAIVVNDPDKYYIVHVSDEVTNTELGTFFSTHDRHTYTHDYGHSYGHGHDSGQWLYNETEFILETTIDYKAEYGTVNGPRVVFAEGHTPADELMVMYLSKALTAPHVFENEQLQIKVSAFARYSAYATKTTTKSTYEVYRYVSGDSIVPVLVGTITIWTISTSAEYVEAAIPGHEGHYVHGHGHSDDHGYSSNAGGGIFFNE